MKTTGFCVLEVGVITGGDILVTLFSPTLGHFEIPMSGDELMIFLCEAGNILADARAESSRILQEHMLQKENRR